MGSTRSCGWKREGMGGGVGGEMLHEGIVHRDDEDFACRRELRVGDIAWDVGVRARRALGEDCQPCFLASLN